MQINNLGGYHLSTFMKMKMKMNMMKMKMTLPTTVKRRGNLFLFFNSFHSRIPPDSHDPKFILQSLRQQLKLGFTNIQPAIYAYHHLNSLRPLPNIIDYCQLFTAILRIKPFPPFATVISLSRHLHLSSYLRPDHYSLTILANCYCRLGFVDFGLINGYCKYRKVDQALSLLQEMPLKGISLNVVTYNTLIDALCKNKRPTQARKLFKEMKAQGLKPNIVTWNSLLDGLCKDAKFDEAMELLKEMEDNGAVADIYTYSILMDGLCKVGRLKEAVDVFSFLRDKGLQPDVRTYTIMIKGFCKKGLLKDAEKLFSKMEDNGCSPNECTFNTIIRGFLHGKDIKRALELVSIMRSKDCVAHNHTISLLVGLHTDPTLSSEDKYLLKKFFEN